MKKVMYINFPQGSHILTSVYLCTELSKENINLIYYTDKKYFKAFGDANIDLRAYPDEFFDLYKELADQQHLYHHMITLYYVFFKFTEVLMPFIFAEIEREKPDFIICDHLAFWGKSAIRKFNLPAFYFFSNLIFRPDDKGTTPAIMLKEFLLGLTVNLKYIIKSIGIYRQLKKQFGLMVWKPEEILDNRNDFSVVMHSRHFQPNGKNYAENYHFIGPGKFEVENFEKKEKLYLYFAELLNRTRPSGKFVLKR